MSQTAPFSLLARRERILVSTGLAIAVLAGWAYLVRVADGMGGMSANMMPSLAAWTAMDAIFMFLMWAVMMATMMIPSAAPMILLYTAIREKDVEHPVTHSGLFAIGYLAVWTGFSAVATLLQWSLESAALLSGSMVSSSPVLGGIILIAAGAYQLTSLKHVCLKHCNSPVQFISSHWRKGPGGAFRMGMDHGLYCIGCCWALMMLLFVGGVMNFLWIAGLSAFVLAEKIMPSGSLFGQAVGGGLILAGILIVSGVV